MTLILASMAEIEQVSCVDFQERDGETDYVFFNADSTACNSGLGQFTSSGQHNINLNQTGCMVRRGRSRHLFCRSGCRLRL